MGSLSRYIFSFVMVERYRQPENVLDIGVTSWKLIVDRITFLRQVQASVACSLVLKEVEHEKQISKTLHMGIISEHRKDKTAYRFMIHDFDEVAQNMASKYLFLLQSISP